MLQKILTIKIRSNVVCLIT